MPKFIVTHTLPPKAISREQFCQISAVTQQDPQVKCHESFANLSEGKIFCYWEGPQPESLIAFFKKHNVPYDAIIRLGDLTARFAEVLAAYAPTYPCVLGSIVRPSRAIACCTSGACRAPIASWRIR